VLNNYFKYNQITTEKPISNEEVIKEEIKEDVTSNTKQSAYNGIMYYRSLNTKIKSREKENFLSTFEHKIANGFLKKIIDQKVNYLLGKKIVIENIEKINQTININKIIRKAAKESCKKGVEWLHPYINNSGEFKISNISGLECIPIYDTEYQEELIQMIRYYKITVLDNKNKKVSRYKVELYDKDKVTYYMQDAEGNYYLDTSIEINPLYYISISTKLGKKVLGSKGNGWGKVPFIPLWNNDDKTNDLEPIKEHIDLYDIVESDFANNLDQLQDVLLVLKNRSPGEYEKFLKNLKKYKIVEVDEDGDLKSLSIDVPVVARKELLSILRDNIFEFGQAVDTRRVADGNTTNVVIKSRYSDLDLKCDDFQFMIEDSIYNLLWFVNKYFEVTGKPTENLENVEITFNRNIIFNESEKVKNFVDQGGRISNKTLLSNHPNVDNVNEELEELEIEEQGFSSEETDNNNNNNDVIDNG